MSAERTALDSFSTGLVEDPVSGRYLSDEGTLVTATGVEYDTVQEATVAGLESFADDVERQVTGVVEGATTGLRNLGPAWLDEAALVLLVLVALFVLRPYAELGAAATGRS